MRTCKDCLYYPICDMPREAEDCGHFEKTIIRCKDCKHHEDEQAGMVYCQHVIGGWADEEWFCADGERKES